jgi:hypothetical protein
LIPLHFADLAMDNSIFTGVAPNSGAQGAKIPMIVLKGGSFDLLK